MKKIGFIITILIFTLMVSLLISMGTVAFAENEVTISHITKISADGEVVEYNNAYSRDVTINYTFETASAFYVNVYEFNGGIAPIRTSEKILVVDKKGSYTVIDDGELRVDCIALDENDEELASISVVIRSDVSAPEAPSIDIDGVLQVSHSEPFSVLYVVNSDALSGVDFTRSTYCFKDVEGNVVKEGIVTSDISKASISDINQNGTLIFTIYDKAGNFVVTERKYDQYYYVSSGAPAIVVTPSSGYSPNVMVSLSWPLGVSSKYYKLIVNGREQSRTAYTAPFSITQEGTVEIRAYYYEEGEQTFVSKTITNVDKTPPTSSSIAETIRVKVDLTSSSPIVLSLTPNDAKSGVKRVYLKNFGTEFTKNDVTSFSLDVTARLGTNVVIVAEDNAGNVTEYNYPLNGYDKEKINYYNNAFNNLNEDAYDTVAWSELLNAYSRLSNLLSHPDSSSGDISSYSKAVDRAIEGKHEVKVTVVESIDGLINDFSAEVASGATDVKKGGKLNLAINKIATNEGELNEKISVGGTIAKFPSYEGYGFNLVLTDRENKAVTIYNQMSVSLTIPGVNKLAKVYYEKDGVLVQLSSSISNNVLTFQTENYGNFYLIVETDIPVDPGKGLMIGDKFYPLNLLLITGGIILGAMLLVGILTPVIYKLIKNKKTAGKKFNYLK
ncbi:MAG: hypothetical protein IKB56_02935 [Clostridia bacterium]|nr:hypothetical protein [Clostridia bacterium]